MIKHKTMRQSTLAILAPAVWLVVVPLSSSAQTSTNAPIGRNNRLTTGAYSSTAPSVIVPKPLTRPASQITLHFDDAPIDAVLDHLSKVAGFEIVKTAAVEGRITLISEQPVTPDEAVSLLNTALKGNGFTAIQMGRILKITSIDKAKHGNIPVHYGIDPTKIADTDDLITQVIPVRSVDAVKLKTDLQPLVSSDADLASNAASNTIIITDTSANVKRIVEIIANLDQKDALENGIRVKHLKYADATAAAKLITDIFKPPATNAAPTSPRAFFRAFHHGGAPEQQESGQTGTVLATADARTNTVVVSGPIDTLKVIDDVLAQLDANPAADQDFFIYRVENGQAVDMMATLNALFGVSISLPNTTSSNTRSLAGNQLSSGFNNSSRTGGGSSFGGGGGGFGGGGGGFGGNSGGFGGGNSNSNRSSNNRNSGSNNNGRSGGGGAGGGGSNASGLSQTLADLTGQVEVVADQDTNTLLVATATKYEQRVRDIIKQLDRPVPQVLIKVLIAEVTHDNSDDLGLDFSVLNTRASGNGQSLSSNLGNAAAATVNGGLAVNVLESNLTATLHALATAGKLDVLSRPYILASDNQEANITVGQEVPFITQSRTDTLGNLINTVQYQTIGIVLDVTPHVNNQGLVVMDVSPQISSQSDTSIQIQQGVFAPVFNNRSAQSRVAIKDGETIVIGGLMQDQKTQTVTKLPILGNIPLLGLLFQRNQVTKTKTELLIFMTPHVAQLPDRLRPMTQDEMKGLRLTPSAVGPGVFQEQLRGMQRGGPATEPSTLEVPPPTTTHSGASPVPPLPGK